MKLFLVYLILNDMEYLHTIILTSYDSDDSCILLMNVN